MEKIRILVADPHELIAEGVRSWLRDDPDMEVVAHVPTGAGLLESVTRDPVDLVLLEVSLPGSDGIDSARALRRYHPAIRVLAHSALTEIEYVNSMLIEGCCGYVVKGTDKQELITAIRTVMAGGCHVSQTAQESIDRGYTYTTKRYDGEYIGLTQREKEVIRLVALERTNVEIGSLLHMSAETVKTHRKRIMSKLNVRSVAGLVKYAVDRRWI